MLASDTALTERTITIGTRGSKLALTQTGIVRDALLNARPDLRIDVKTITTKGDVVQDRPLSEIGGDGLFVRQIETALRDREIDLAVHSAKDLSSLIPEDMAIAAYLPRADVRDVLVSSASLSLDALPEGTRVGTSSPRRACQLKALRPDLVVLDIRGNVDTRLRKLQEGQYDAIVLAAAGLERLGLLAHVTQWLEPEVMLPAVAQGALAIEVRAMDSSMLELAATLNDPDTALAVSAERAFLARIGGGCSLPIGAYAKVEGGRVHLTGFIGSHSGKMVRGGKVVPAEDAELAGRELAGELLMKGGAAFVLELEGGTL